MMEFDEIVVKESPGLCRCCLSEGCYKDLGTEYTWMNETEVYADMLLECFDISITQHNEGPNGPNRLICEVCITRLRDACNFKKQVMDSEKKFIDMMGRGEFRPKMLIYQTQLKCEDATVEEAVDDADVEYLEDEIDFGDDVLKDESTQPSVSDITVSTLPVKTKRGRPRKSTPVKPEKRAKVAKVDDKAKTSKAVAKGDKPRYYKPIESSSMKRRRNLEILFNNTSIIPFKWRMKYTCFYCSKDCAEYTELRKHTKEHGHCSVKDQSLKLLRGQNMEIKIDVSVISCELCEETLPSLDEIVTHLFVEHNLKYDKDIEMEIGEYRLSDLSCTACDEKFTYFGYLVSHVNNNHYLKNCLICEYCEQKFNKKRDLILHMKKYHREGGYQCEMCSQSFTSLNMLKKHKNNRHVVKCNICNLKLPSTASIQRHIYLEHLNNAAPEQPNTQQRSSLQKVFYSLRFGESCCVQY